MPSETTIQTESVLRDLGAPTTGNLTLPAEGDPATQAAELRARADNALADDGALLLVLPPAVSDEELARWRNALWPTCHVNAIYASRPGKGVIRRTLQRSESIQLDLEPSTILVARRRPFVLAPDVTVEKFDKAAAGWNGVPGTPGYPHHRWMRRFVGLFSSPRGKQRILDFGCGAGWVGIEAAKLNPGCTLCAFDPSPQMVHFSEENAQAAGVKEFIGRTGFGEDPPFPADGEKPFDLVISSGVVSFARDKQRWFEGLLRSVAPGGTLVIGDIHPGSRGMRSRRRTKPMVPVREMNALTREEARAELEARGLRHVTSCGYQLTYPIPQAMHFNETRLKGLLTWPLLGLNMTGASLDRALGSPLQDQFDSWVMHFERPAE